MIHNAPDCRAGNAEHFCEFAFAAFPRFIQFDEPRFDAHIALPHLVNLYRDLARHQTCPHENAGGPFCHHCGHPIEPDRNNVGLVNPS